MLPPLARILDGESPPRAVRRSSTRRANGASTTASSARVAQPVSVSALRSLALLALALAGLSCAGDERSGGSSTLRELERLAFVPAGQFALATPQGNLVFGVREALLVDRFEVRREDWLERAAELGPAPAELADFIARWDRAERDRPMTFVTQREAQRFAQLRGMRLLTAAEWIYVSAGPQRFPFPWGVTPQRGVANTLELELGRLSPCGAFEAGRTAMGVYDLHGNASEWVADLVVSPDRRPDDERVGVLGGSFRTYSRPLLVGEGEPFGRAIPPLSRADDLGWRCCAEAAPYLRERAAAIRLDSAERIRLLAIGRRWGRRALPLLADLSTAPNAAPALRVLAEGAAQ